MFALFLFCILSLDLILNTVRYQHINETIQVDVTRRAQCQKASLFGYYTRGTDYKSSVNVPRIILKHMSYVQSSESQLGIKKLFIQEMEGM